jgi:hypothetical protein
MLSTPDFSTDDVSVALLVASRKMTARIPVSPLPASRRKKSPEGLFLFGAGISFC